MVTRARWDPAKHPRGPFGRFIDTSGQPSREHRPPYNLRTRQAQLRDRYDWLGQENPTEGMYGYVPDREINRYYTGSNGFPLVEGRELGPLESVAVENYVTGGAQVNNLLRSTFGNASDLDPDVDAMDSAIEATQLRADTTVYRGVAIGMMSDVKPGEQIHDFAYTSTALDPGNTRMFGGDMLEIELPAGTHAHVVGEGLHRQGSASEIILGRGAVFEIVETWKQPDGDDPIVGPYEGARITRARLVGYLDS